MFLKTVYTADFLFFFIFAGAVIILIMCFFALAFNKSSSHCVAYHLIIFRMNGKCKKTEVTKIQCINITYIYLFLVITEIGSEENSHQQLQNKSCLSSGTSKVV